MTGITNEIINLDVRWDNKLTSRYSDNMLKLVRRPKDLTIRTGDATEIDSDGVYG